MATDDREIDDKYSIEDYKILVDQSPSYNLINHIGFMIRTGYAYNDSSCTSIKKYVMTNFEWFGKLIYEMPLDDTPLFINHESDLVRSIIRWRLNLGI